MKTLYTLLLAFGLCLTSHAQSMQNYDTYYNQASVTEKVKLNSFLNSAPYKMIFDQNQESTFLYNDGNSLKVIEIVNVNGFNQSILDTNNTEFSDVKMITIKINDQTSSISLDLSNLIQLEYLILELDSLNVVSNLSSITQTISLPIRVKVIYRYQTVM